jgi:hypothetical protein
LRGDGILFGLRCFGHRISFSINPFLFDLNLCWWVTSCQCGSATD